MQRWPLALWQTLWQVAWNCSRVVKTIYCHNLASSPSRISRVHGSLAHVGIELVKMLQTHRHLFSLHNALPSKVDALWLLRLAELDALLKERTVSS